MRLPLPNAVLYVVKTYKTIRLLAETESDRMPVKTTLNT